MKKMVFIMACLLQISCLAEHIILNFWQDKYLRVRHAIEIPLSLAEHSKIFKAMLDASDNDLSKVDEYITELPFTTETMASLLALMYSLYECDLCSSSDIDMIIDEDISKTLYVLEAARFFNLSRVISMLQDIVTQKTKDYMYFDEHQKSKFYNDFLMYFSSYDSFSKTWLLSQSWERKWHMKYNKDEAFYLGYRPRLYSIFTLMMNTAVMQEKGILSKAPSLSKSKCV